MQKFLRAVIVILTTGLFLNIYTLPHRAQAADYRVTGIEVKELQEEIQVLITSDGPPKHKVFELEDPPRVRIFLPGGILTLKEERVVFKEGLIKKIEASQYDTRPHIIKIDIYLAYTTDFEVISHQNRLTLSLAKRVKPIPKEMAREAKRHYKLAKRYYQREEFEKAIAEFEAALDFDPKLTRAKNFIFQARAAIREREQEIALARRRVEEEIRKEAAQKAWREREEKIGRHYARAKGYYREGKLSEAINEFMVVYTLDPEYKGVSKYITKIQDRLSYSAEKRMEEEAISKMRVGEGPVRVEAPERVSQETPEKEEAPERVEEEAPEKVAEVPGEVEEEKAPERVEEEAPDKVEEVPIRVSKEAIYQVREVQVKELPEETRVIIVTDQEVEYSPFTLSEPFRLVIDIPQAILTWEEKRLMVEKGGIQGIRAGQFSSQPPIARIVIDLTREVEYEISRELNLILIDIKDPAKGAKGKEVKKTEEMERKVPGSEIDVEKNAVGVEEEAKEARVSIPEEAEYIIQTGDVLGISVWQFEELSRKVTVRSDGRISYPLAGDLRAGGLTPTQLSGEIAKKLTRFVREPQITIDIVGSAQKKVFILGEVPKPGIYEWKGELRLLEAIMMTGGLAKDADFERITVTTGQGRIIPANLNRLIFQGDMSQNILLQSEDTIYVPAISLIEKNRVFILGEVETPGRYYIEEGQRVVEAIMQAKGYTDDAVIRSIAVIRGDISNPQVMLVNLSRIIRKGETYRNILLQSEDIIYVPRRFIINVNYFLKAFLPAIQTAYYLDSLGIVPLRE